jgi:citronellol/citronellal dehydrogenase
MKNKTVFITGGSRGIGLAIGLRLAREGANVAIASKTSEPHPRLPGTIYTAAAAIEAAGGQALPLKVDIREEEQLQAAVEETARIFGGIDLLINNASAISLTSTLYTDMKHYDLMHHINTRGTFLASKLCIPFLRKSDNPHVLNLSPPLNMESRWFAPHVAYTMAKFGMSMCVLGMAEEFRKEGIAFNALWPRTAIATAAVQNLLGGEEAIRRCRTADIMADAAYAILKKNSRECTGNFFVDEEVLRGEGMTDFSQYRADASLSDEELLPDFFL